MTVIESKIQLWFTVPRFDFLASLLLLTMANCSLGVGNLAPAFWRASCWTLVIVTLKLFSAQSWNASLCTIDVFFSIFASLGSCRLQLYTVIEIILTIYQYVNKIVESQDCQTYYIWGITMFDRDCKPRDYISINLQMKINNPQGFQQSEVALPIPWVAGLLWLHNGGWGRSWSAVVQTWEGSGWIYMYSWGSEVMGKS